VVRVLPVAAITVRICALKLLAWMYARKDSVFYRWCVILLLSGAMAFSLIDRFALSLLFEPIKQDLGVSDTQLGLLHGVAFGLFYAAMGIPLGRLVDRWSRKWVIIWGICVWSIATAACGFARSFLALLLARIGVGAGEAALAPAGYSMISDITPKTQLASAISVFQMGSLLGAGLAFLAGGAVYQAMTALSFTETHFLAGFSAWQLTFIVVALPGIFFILAFMLVSEPERRINIDTDNVEINEQNDEGLLQHLKENVAYYSALFLGAASVVAISYAFVSWAPTVLTRVFSLEVGKAGIFLGLIFVTTAPLGVLCGGLLADFWTGKGKKAAFPNVLLLAAVAALPVMLGCFFVNSAFQFSLIIGITQFTTGLAIGVGPATIQISAPAHLRGQMSAIYVFAVNLIGLGVGPIVIGVLSDRLFTGNSGLLMSLSGYTLTMCILGVVCLYCFRRIFIARALVDS